MSIEVGSVVEFDVVEHTSGGREKRFRFRGEVLQVDGTELDGEFHPIRCQVGFAWRVASGTEGGVTFWAAPDDLKPVKAAA